MFSMLLDARDEQGEGFTPQELRDQVMHLLFGGHDTTSSTLSFLMYELSRNPVVLSWATHRLPEIFPNPEAFIPERFTPEARRRLRPGGCIPFGGGQRICIGKRFGQLVVKAVATAVLQRFRCELRPGYELHVSKLPTLSPEGGLPMVVRPRTVPAAAGLAPLSFPVRAAG